MKKSENGDGEEGREQRLPPGFLHADDFVLCGKLEEDLKIMSGQFFEVCRRGLKVNVGKSKVMVLGVEEGLECEIHVDAGQSNIWGVLNESGTDIAVCFNSPIFSITLAYFSCMRSYTKTIAPFFS